MGEERGEHDVHVDLLDLALTLAFRLVESESRGGVRRGVWYRYQMSSIDCWIYKGERKFGEGGPAHT